MITFQPATTPLVKRSASQLKRECGIEQQFMSEGSRLRQRARSMKPLFITVHSTQNKRASAKQHSTALLNERLPHNWHFTIDNYVSIQHIPLNETGRHADSGRTGDMFSIGIEMCEDRSQILYKTYDRTAKTCAWLMKEYNIPLRNVVPHNFWTGKNCPHVLMDNARPGYKWKWFLSRVDYYFRCINSNQSNL